MSFYFIKMILIKEMRTNLQFENTPRTIYNICISKLLSNVFHLSNNIWKTLKIDFFSVIRENITNKKNKWKNKHYFNTV